MRRVRLALVGLGTMGSIHFKLLTERLSNIAELVAVCDIDESRLAEPAKRGIRVYRSYSDMISEGGFDGIIIATPPNLHRDQAVEALRKGLYVLLEKPMATNLRDALEIYSVAKGSGRLMIAFSLRFHELYQKVKRFLDEELGNVITQWHVALGKIPPAPWIARREASGGMLCENGVHVVYYQTWFAGRVVEVYAKTATLTPGIDIEDNVALVMKHESGAISTFIQSWSGGHRWRKWGLVAEKGRVTVEGYLGGEYTVSRSDGTVIESGSFESPIEEMYAAQLRHFIECVANGWRPAVNEEDGIHIQQVVEAAYISSREGKPVKLPLA